MSAPLEGMVVLELTQFVAGPYAGSILASMGARVIKIERPQGDEFRATGPLIHGVSLPFQMLNHNKQGIVVDLKRARGAEVVRRLALTADVVLESSRPGTYHRLGVGYEDLAPVNPRLIYCSLSGFGQTGPYRDRGGVDIVAQAMGGLMGITGEPGGRPVKVSYPITDLGAGMWAVIGVLGALAARQTTGRGQRIDAALLDCPIAWSIWEASRYFGLGEVPGPLGSSHRNVAPYRAMACADGRFIVIGVASQPMWERFCPAIGASRLLENPDYATLISRREHREALEAALEPIFLTRTSGEWLRILEAASVACGPVYRYDEALADPQVQERALVARLAHPQAGDLRVIDVPVHLSDTARVPVAPAPALGADTTAVLAAAGFATSEIAALAEEGVIVQG